MRQHTAVGSRRVKRVSDLDAPKRRLHWKLLGRKSISLINWIEKGLHNER